MPIHPCLKISAGNVPQVVTIIENITVISRSQHSKIEPSHRQGDEGPEEGLDIGPREAGEVDLLLPEDCTLIQLILLKKSTPQKMSFSQTNLLID